MTETYYVEASVPGLGVINIYCIEADSSGEAVEMVRDAIDDDELDYRSISFEQALVDAREMYLNIEEVK